MAQAFTPYWEHRSSWIPEFKATLVYTVKHWLKHRNKFKVVAHAWSLSNHKAQAERLQPGLYSEFQVSKDKQQQQHQKPKKKKKRNQTLGLKTGIVAIYDTHEHLWVLWVYL